MSRTSFGLLVALILSCPFVAYAGSISGTVVADLDGSPIEGASIQVNDALSQNIGFATTDATGTYTIDGLAAATYIMTIDAFGYVTERYDDVSCLQGCQAGSGTPIDLAADDELTGFDARLTRFGEIVGRVTDATSDEPLSSVQISVRPADGSGGFRSALTSGDGSYSISLLPPGAYVVAAESSLHRDEVYDDVPCQGGFFFGCEPQDGTPVQVMLDTVTTGIDFGLDRFGEITGRVTAEATAEPLANVIVTAFAVADGQATSVSTDADGRYVVGLPTGEYTLVTESQGQFIDELYNDRVCFLGGCDPTTGDRVAVGLSTTTAGIDFALAAGGEITGRVTDAVSGEPVPNAVIIVLDDAGQSVSTAFTDLDGRYVVSALDTGTYKATASGGTLYETQLYDNMRCDGGCDLDAGTPIEVEIGGTTGGVDFDLVAFGQFTGTIRDASTGEGIPFATISIFIDDGRLWGELPATADGSYQIIGLTDGEYFVAARADGYLGTLYPAIPCQGATCDPTSGQPVVATFGEITSGIDIDLPIAGAVSGTVRTTSGEAIGGVEVAVYDDRGDRIDFTFTDGNGAYRLLGLDTGVVYVVASASGFLAEAWDDTPCAIDCDPTSGDPVAVVVGRETPDIDFTLARLGTIRGTVLNGDNRLPTEFAVVDVWNSSGGLASSVLASAPDGRWTSEPLLPGRYFVTTNASGYRDQAWDGLDCEPSCDPTTATPIDVVNDVDVTGIDFSLLRLRGIAGTVTGTNSPVGVAGVEVGAWRLPDGTFEASTTTGPSGGYSMDLAPGVFTIGTGNDQGATDELWDDIACPDGSPLDGLCDPTDGNPVTIQPETRVTGLDFALEGLQPGCRETDTTLCLADGRFRVEATWRDSDGNAGTGRLRTITGDTGYVWFFNRDNVEVVVKVLDACVAPFDRFWVFAAGLTDVEVTLTVTDVVTDTTKTYTNPLATPFQPILDTDAFASCDAAGVAPRDAAASEARDVSAILDELADVLGTGSLDVADTPCGTGDHLCLTDERFRVEASWRSADGSGTASAVPLTLDTGYFWFFGPDNVEVVVKVLDACFAPFDRFWVFAAGLTDVEIDLTVTDRLSGASTTYSNALGQPFEPILDTDAFETCSF